MTNNNSTLRALQEENHHLKQLVGELKEDVKQKDILIAALESQIAALIRVNRAESTQGEIIDYDEYDDTTNGDTDGEGNDLLEVSDSISRVSSLGVGSIMSPKKNSNNIISTIPAISSNKNLPPRPPIKAGGNQQSNSNRCHHQYSDDESTPPPKPRTGVSGLPPPYPLTSLRPPSRSNIEMNHPPAPTTQHESKTNNGTNNKKKKNSKNNKNVDNNNNNDQHPGQRGKILTSNKAKAAIKALPRELSIYNNDDDDVTKYSVDDGQPIYEVEKTEFRDAYNARGLYTGTIHRAEQMPHGFGKMEYHVGGRYYEGDWHMGHWHGQGIIRNPEGDIYEGQVVNDLKQGCGKMTYIDGRVFQGMFKEDEAVEGTITFPDGAKYVGQLHNGARHGYGVYYFTDGSKYEGESTMNVFEGKGKMTWNDGGYYEGEWSQGEIHGHGKEIRPDGSLRHDGRWSKGVPIRE